MNTEQTTSPFKLADAVQHMKTDILRRMGDTKPEEDPWPLMLTVGEDNRLTLSLVDGSYMENTNTKENLTAMAFLHCLKSRARFWCFAAPVWMLSHKETFPANFGDDPTATEFWMIWAVSI